MTESWETSAFGHRAGYVLDSYIHYLSTAMLGVTNKPRLLS